MSLRKDKIIIKNGGPLLLKSLVSYWNIFDVSDNCVSDKPSNFLVIRAASREVTIIFYCMDHHT
jgi:hypothetical protein